MNTRSFKAASMALFLSAAIAVVNAPPVSAQEAGELSLRFSGIATPKGALFVALYDSEAAFGGGKPVGSWRVPVEGASASQTVPGLKPGRYAVKVFHDVDGDGKMGLNGFGIPVEPYAASNNAPAAMGPPRWEDAEFEVGPDGASQTIVID